MPLSLPEFAVILRFTEPQDWVIGCLIKSMALFFFPSVLHFGSRNLYLTLSGLLRRHGEPGDQWTSTCGIPAGSHTGPAGEPRGCQGRSRRSVRPVASLALSLTVSVAAADAQTKEWLYSNTVSMVALHMTFNRSIVPSF